jgi:hypothetical protein
VSAGVFGPGDVTDYLAATSFELDAFGAPKAPLVFVNLDEPLGALDLDWATAVAAAVDTCVVVGLASQPINPKLRNFTSALDCTLVEGVSPIDETCVTISDIEVARKTVTAAISLTPRAAITLAELLRSSDHLPIREGLLEESLAFSMLLAGPEFARWRVSRKVSPPPDISSPTVLVERDGGILSVTLNNPSRHNALGRELRDELIAAIDIANGDSTITQLRLKGAGPSFCSGGDLNEFGRNHDPSVAHLVRLDRSIAARLNMCRDRAVVELHGACIGAGIEISSFARKVTAAEDTIIQLPEVSMGLVPGAGGTVGITRRIGRWRTAYMALTGDAIDAETALSWGLVDEIPS